MVNGIPIPPPRANSRPTKRFLATGQFRCKSGLDWPAAQWRAERSPAMLKAPSSLSAGLGRQENQTPKLDFAPGTPILKGS